MKDWEGRDVPVDESPDAIIRVWNIDPHPNPDYSCLVVRGWQDTLEAIKSTAEYLLESDETPTASEPLSIKIWSSRMTRKAYDELLLSTT